MTATLEEIRRAEKSALAGEQLDREAIIRLLEIPLDSEEDRALRLAARRVSDAVSGDTVKIWAAIGVDSAPCTMNCRFCSFGAAWGLIKEPVHFTREELLMRAGAFIRQGAYYVVLRTTEFYDMDELLETVRQIRAQNPGEYEILLNTGEITPELADRMYEAGVRGIYHACRLREGVDTPFDPDLRRGTMRNVAQSRLNLFSLVDPVAPIHSNEEVADNLLQLLDCGAVLTGAMALVPVPGTPLGDREAMSDHRLAQIGAVIRLSAGSQIKDICIHPSSVETIQSGASVIIVDSGTIPRTTERTVEEWYEFGMDKAAATIAEAGYKMWK